MVWRLTLTRRARSDAPTPLLLRIWARRLWMCGFTIFLIGPLRARSACGRILRRVCRGGRRGGSGLPSWAWRVRRRVGMRIRREPPPFLAGLSDEFEVAG